MSQWADVKIGCPYYRGMVEQRPKCYITCDGGHQDVGLQMVFSNQAARLQHVLRFCAGDRWNCPACMAIDFVYEREEEQ